MNLLPHSVATLTLAVSAVSAVPGVSPFVTTHGQPQHHAVAPAVARPHAFVRPALHLDAVHPAAVRPAAVHPALSVRPHALVRPAAMPARQGMPGAWTPQNVGSPQVLEAASFAVGDLSEEFGGDYVVETIDRAESQVVEGTNYQLKLRIARVQDQVLGARKDCTVTVWSKPSARTDEKVTSFTCQAVDAALPAAPAAAHPVVESVTAKRAIAPLATVAVVKKAVANHTPAERPAAHKAGPGKAAGHKAAAHKHAAHKHVMRKHQVRKHVAKRHGA
jgi:hypothetical protein